VDRGPQYRSAVFYHTPEQKAAAVRGRRARGGSHLILFATSRRAFLAASQEASRDALQKSGVFGAGVPLVTEITPASTFWCGPA
jgi:peptide methionine sulfoxide reductase MsrA